MLAVLTDGIRRIDDGENGDEDVTAVVLDHALREQDAGHPEHQSFDDHDGGPSHPLEEGQLQRPLDGNPSEFLQTFLELIDKEGRTAKGLDCPNVADSIRNQATYEFLGSF